jgi:hypothetical protein
MYDPIKLALWAVGISLVIAVGCALYVVAANAGSRYLVLAFIALVGACGNFYIQLYFELRGSTTAEDFAVEFTIDYETKSIHTRQAFLGHASYGNIFVEAEAGKFLSTASPPLIRDDAPKIARDATILSVLSYLIDEQFDWQLNTIVYKTSLGTMSETLSAPRECTSLSRDQLRGKLTQSGNMFANVERIGTTPAPLCLPPNSTIDVTANSVVLTTRVCQISIGLREPFTEKYTSDPTSHNVAMPILGTPRYVNIVLGARATVTYFAYRAQAPDLPKYQARAKRLVEGLKTWFAINS